MNRAKDIKKAMTEAYKVRFDIDSEIARKICEIYSLFKLNDKGNRISLLNIQYSDFPLKVESSKSLGLVIITDFFNRIKFHLNLTKPEGSVQFSKAPDDIMYYDEMFDHNIEVVGFKYHDIDILKRLWTIKRITND